MSAIPGEPQKRKPPLLTMKDGRRIALHVPGLPKEVKPDATEQRGAVEPPREDVRTLPFNPNHAG